ncbi:hypothetical protein [Enterococcus hulanensis]|uniref:hypothetical protein n=1 Tax=Enterococcus hulanensis TaxID=2559929 RepID=UPI0010F4D530|nr:hypothetical protein [Enterococcus hulanensis]
MINVKVVESDALLITSQTYSYVDFEDISEDLVEGDRVRFILSENDVNLFEGLFEKEVDLTVHQYISLKIEQMVADGKVKKRMGRELLKKLDKEFFVPDENTNDGKFKSPPSFKKKPKTEKQTKIKPVKTPKEKREIPFKLPDFPFRKIGLGVFIVVLVGSVVFFGVNAFGNFNSSSANKRESYESLINGEKYEKAAKEYPKKLKEIEQAIVESKDFDELEKFNEKYPTAEGKFDLAFHLKNWETVIETDQSTLTKERQVMLAYAFIQLDKLDEADILNKKLTSKKLSEALNLAYKQRAIKYVQAGKFADAQKINDRIDDTDLFELIQTGKSCQEMIDYYSEKKDKDNESTWRNRLENLGKDLIEK